MNMEHLPLLLVLLFYGIYSEAATDCDFEAGICGWQQLTTDDFDWTRHSGPTSTLQTGPDVDHTTGTANGYYVYTESSWPRGMGDNAILRSPDIVDLHDTDIDLCFTFWYHMFGLNIGTLSLYYTTSDTSVPSSDLVWAKSNEQGYRWIEAEIRVTDFVTTSTQSGYFAFEGRINSYTADMAIDDITLGSCSETLNCDFEEGDCGWEQLTSDEFDWTRYSGPTPTTPTGPDFDHTTGTAYGYYMYTEAGPWPIPAAGDNAIMRSPYPIQLQSTYIDICFAFWFHMYGLNIGTLNVYFTTSALFTPAVDVIWSKTGEKGNAWIEAEIRVTSFIPTSKTGYFAFEGVMTGGYFGDIAVDDVMLRTCIYQPTTREPTTTTPLPTTTDATTTIPPTTTKATTTQPPPPTTTDTTTTKATTIPPTTTKATTTQPPPPTTTDATTTKATTIQPTTTKITTTQPPTTTDVTTTRATTTEPTTTKVTTTQPPTTTEATTTKATTTQPTTTKATTTKPPTTTDATTTRATTTQPTTTKTTTTQPPTTTDTTTPRATTPQPTTSKATTTQPPTSAQGTTIEATTDRTTLHGTTTPVASTPETTTDTSTIQKTTNPQETTPDTITTVATTAQPTTTEATTTQPPTTTDPTTPQGTTIEATTDRTTLPGTTTPLASTPETTTDTTTTQKTTTPQETTPETTTDATTLSKTITPLASTTLETTTDITTLPKITTIPTTTSSISTLATTIITSDATTFSPTEIDTTLPITSDTTSDTTTEQQSTTNEQDDCSQSNIGRRFFVAFPRHRELGTEINSLQITTSSSQAVSIVVSEWNGNTFPGTVTNSVVGSFDLSENSRCIGSGVQNCSVEISADGDISVIGYSESGPSVGSFLAFPVESLGKEYVVASFSPAANFYSEFTVTAADTAATVTVEFTSNVQQDRLSNGFTANLDFQLDAGQTYQVRSTIDLTGSRVVSSAPVSVISGTSCANVPTNVSYCDYLVEQMPPVNTLGRSFTVSSYHGRPDSGITYRTIATRDNTQVTTTLGTANLQASEFFDTDVLTQPVIRPFSLAIESSEPILVVQFQKGIYADYRGDPSMSIIPPSDQFAVGSVTFPVASSFASSNYISVVLSTADEDGIELDGVLLDSSSASRTTTPLTTVWSTNVTEGVHTVQHTDPDVPFNVLLYGHDYYKGYATPAGTSLTPASCRQTTTEYVTTYSTTTDATTTDTVTTDSTTTDVTTTCGCKHVTTDSTTTTTITDVTTTDTVTTDSTTTDVTTTCGCKHVTSDSTTTTTTTDVTTMDTVTTDSTTTTTDVTTTDTVTTDSTTTGASTTADPLLDGRSSGTNFAFAFPTNSNHRPSTETYLIFTTTANGTVSVVVTGDQFSSSFSMDSSTPHTLRVEPIPLSVGSGFQNSTVVIEASDEVSVQGRSVDGISLEEFTPISYSGLGTEYVIASYPPLSGYQSQFTLTTGEAVSTQVTIRFVRDYEYEGETYNQLHPLEMDLQSHETVQFQSLTDLTGSTISSTRPVSVVSGDSCAQVPVDVQFCNYMVEQLPPVQRWGRTVVFSSYHGRTSGTIIRIIVSLSGASLNIQSGFTTMQSFTSSTAAFFDLDIGHNTDPITIMADNPILVLMYHKSVYTDYIGDPAMAIVPAVEQWTSGAVTFDVVDQQSTQAADHISIAIETANEAGVSLDNQLVSTISGVESLRHDLYTIFRLNVDPGYHTVHHQDNSVRFSVLVYGTNIYNSYAYPARMELPVTLVTSQTQHVLVEKIVH